MAFQRGSIVLAPFPFTDLSTTKVRPAAVLSGTLYHGAEPDILLGAITSNLAAATGKLDFVPADWQLAGLRFASAFKPILLTLDPARVIHPIGTLTAGDLTEIEKRLRLALEL
ncbi:MAG: type II toxin-antitoxin system PemK/MazF family toxin [Chloroflexi bacterium]|nr:type II toxin-antitoxin system PemK/MazF family toxin [Chloroflexota bacterium]